MQAETHQFEREKEDNLSNQNYFCQANQLMQAGKIEEAILSYQKAIEVNPNFAWYHHNLGDARVKMEHLDEAIGSYRRALEIQPNLAWTHNNLGEVLAKQGHLELALEEFKQATELEPNFYGFQQNLAEVSLFLKRRQAGVTAYCKALELRATLPSFKDLKEESEPRDSSQDMLRGLVICKSISQPLTGPMRSIVEVVPYLRDLKRISLDFQETKDTSIFEKLVKELPRYDFLLFNSVASFLYPLQFKQILSTALKKLKIPIFIYWHETNWALESLKKSSPKIFAEIASLSSHPLVFHLTVSEVCSQAVNKFFPNAKSRTFNIHNCTSVPREESKILSPEQPPYIINMATIQERKGTDLFIETALKVCRQHSSVKFIWLGATSSYGNYNHKEWLSKIEAAGLQERIVFPGHLEKPHEYLKCASLYFLASRDDPFPLSILEAMYLGRTVLTFDVGGAPEALGGHGIVIQPFDTDAAAQKILECLEKPPHELVNKEVRQRYLERYTPELSAKRLNSCIRQGIIQAQEQQVYKSKTYQQNLEVVQRIKSTKQTKKNECFIIGSGRSLLNLTSEEKQYLNAHPNVLALNKYLLFYETIGILPKALFIADGHYPTPMIVFKIMRKAQTLAQKPTYYLDEFYRKLFVIPPLESVWARKQRDKMFTGHEYVAPLGIDYPNVAFFKHRWAEYSGFSWAKTLKEPLYWFHTSLLTAINLAFIIYPGCDIKLLGVDLQGAEAFYHEEIMKHPDLLDHHYQRSIKELGQHPTAVAQTPDGRTMFDALEMIVLELEKHGVKLLSCNPNSLLVTKNICQHTMIFKNLELKLVI